MLIEMKSPAFKKQGEERPPIHFKEGLNVVLGKEDGAMSIGKSSSLLAIDFVFGGDTYIKSDGVKKRGIIQSSLLLSLTERSSILPEIRATVTLFLFVIRITN